ncbi:hypothetical protein WMY93_029012 [Mugilogobius chulae]|uniref:C1q domain-containing protein n=1 Tax=Mugilogobius chulae TaxID=88201 RepID=A0AAW0MWP3_9GOBI
MEHETDGRIGAASAVMRLLYQTIVVKKELSQKAKLSIYRSIHIPTLTCGHVLWQSRCTSSIMKAFVVLCALMGSSLASGQGASCSSGVCGCCLMTKQLERMDQFFQMSYDHMTEELTAAKTAINDIRASRTSFSAVLSNPTQNCNNQVVSATATRVKYNMVKVNMGNNYNSTTGEFTAPRKGVYSFALTLYNLGPYKSCATLMVNGIAKYALMERRTADTQDSASVSISLSLEAGDKVYVEEPANCVMCAHDNLYNTFTGYLMYTKD